MEGRFSAVGPCVVSRAAMALNHEWNALMLRSLDVQWVASARHGQTWRWTIGNLWRSEAGEVHVCDATCNRWVLRGDGLRFCAITGLCKSLGSEPSARQHLKRKELLPHECDHAMRGCPEEAQEQREPNAPAKRRSLGCEPPKPSEQADQHRFAEEQGLCECAGYYGRCGMHC